MTGFNWRKWMQRKAGERPAPQRPNPEEVATGPADEQRRLHLVFRGEVQGVGFRWTARRCAVELDLTGWVRNEWDGSVTMELQGTNAQIALFFTQFNDSYKDFRINYVIDEKEDIPLRDDEGGFEVAFT